MYCLALEWRDYSEQAEIIYNIRREKKDEYYRRKIRTGIYPHVQ